MPRMDEVTKRIIVEAAKWTPRYLFRAWTNVPPPCGESVGLNTTEVITPRAFFHKNCGATKQIYDLTRPELYAMCWDHLTGILCHTEFSSWASSLQVAFRFAGLSGRTGQYYISIIDTRALPNPIFYIPSLAPILGTTRNDHEYLAHGIISGAAHKAVSVQAMLDIGIPEHFEWSTPMPLCTAENWASRNEITPDECDNAQSVARLLWRDGMHGVDHKINEYLLAAGFEVPNELCADDSILTDIVYTKGYGGVEQMIRMLRAIVDLRYGRGARIKRPTEKVRAG